MFNKKNDPLVESVKAVMKQNEVHRQAEAALNEELGISSKKALPHEYHAQYDALLEEKRKVFHADVEAAKLGSRVGLAVKEKLGKLKQKIGDIADKTNKRPKDTRPDMMEEEGSKPRNSREAKLAAMKEPHDKITHADVLKGRGVIAQEESGLKSTMNGTDTPAKGAKPAGKLEEKTTEEQKAKIKKVMRHWKAGEQHIGKSEETVPTTKERQKQAVAIALRMAKVPKKLAEDVPTSSHRATKDISLYIAKSAGHKNRDTLTKARDEIHRYLNSGEGESPDLLDSYNRNPHNKKTHEKIYNAAVTKRELDEAQGNVKPGDVKPGDVKPGDVNPSEMTPISKGLQDRIVKDPPNPKPETKQMNEASYGGKLVAAIRKQREMSADPDVDLKPKPANLSLGAREMVKRGAKLSMRESVIAEIRENLEANLIAIHESGDDELFENYVNSLTEEELEILGLAEDWRSAAFGDNTSGGSLSNAGYRTPPSVAAQARGARPQQQARPSPSPAARPASSPATVTPGRTTSTMASSTTPATTNNNNANVRIAGKPAVTPKLSMPSSAPNVPKPSPTNFVPDNKEANPLSMPSSAPNVPNPSPGQEKSKIMSPSTQKFNLAGMDTNRSKSIVPNDSNKWSSGAQAKETGMGLDTNRSSPTGTQSIGSGDASMELDNTKKPAQSTSSKSSPTNVSVQGFYEQTKPQIKESLESFLRNRFLKG